MSGATLLAQYLGGRPLYSVLLERILMQNGTPPEKPVTRREGNINQAFAGNQGGKI